MDDPTCPFDWTCTDVGNVGVAGTQSVSGGTWTVSGGGLGIPSYWDNVNDQFHFVSQSLNGSGSVTARLTALSGNTTIYAKMGVMFRQGMDSQSPNYLVYVDGNGHFGVSYRRYEGGSTYTVMTQANTLPTWMRIVRTGVVFTAYASSDGSSWSPIAGSTVTLSLSDTVSAGLAVSSGNSGGLGTGTFDNVSVANSGGDPVTSCPTSLGWTCSDIGSPSVAGHDAAQDGTTWAIDGGGTGMAGQNGYGGTSGNDVFHLTWKTLAASGNVSARVFAQTNPNPDNNIYALSGVMLRASTDPQAPYYAIVLQPNGTTTVEYRRYQGGGTGSVAGPTLTVPAYLRVERQGTTFNAYTSSDGSTWSAVSGGQVSLVMSGAVLAGMMVTSGGSAPDATGSFDTVSVNPYPGPPIVDCPSDWSCADIGNPTVAGTQSSSAGQSWAINGGGAGFYLNTNSDQFHYIWQTFGGGVTITAHLVWVANTSSYAEGGILFRTGTSPTAPYYKLSFVQYYGIEVRYRRENGNIYWPYRDRRGFSQVPHWLRVVWNGGNSFTPYDSYDGVTWTALTNDPNNPPPSMGTALGGLEATDGSGHLGTAGMDGVSVVSSGSGVPGTGSVGSPSINCPTCNHTHYPINAATGAFWHTFTDLAIPGRGMPLMLTRTYDSRNAWVSGPLGYGWTDSYNMSLTTDSSGNIAVHEEEGSSVPFALNGSNYQAPSWVLATLVKNGDGTLTFKRFRDQVQYVFSAPSQSAPGQLLREVDRNGYTTTLAYTGGQLTSVTDPAGRSLTLTYNAAGYVATITDNANRSESFSYDAAGNLTSATDVANNTTSFTYDANHLLLTMTDPRGTVIRNTYDGQFRVTKQAEDPTALNRVMTFSYALNTDGTHSTTVTDPMGNVEVDTFRSNEPISITEASGTSQAATCSYTFDPTTLGVTSITDPNNQVWQATYDSRGNLLTVTDPLNHTTTYTYDSLNDVTSITDPTGITTTFTYDSAGNLQAASRPLVGTSQMATATLIYGDGSHPGDITQMQDPDGHSSSFNYDAFGELTQAIDPVGDITTYRYDTAGRLTSVVSPNGNVTGGNPAAFTTTATYNAYGEPLTITDPLSQTTTYTYDADGNLATVTDPLNHTTSYTYDRADEVIQITRSDSSTETYSYDRDGNELSWTDGLNRTTSYAYDALNQVTSQTDPLQRTMTYGYDAAGNITSVVDALNQTTTYGYDSANRLTSVAHSDGTTPNVTFGYDADNRRTSMTDGTGSSSYAYDSLNRLTQSTDGAGNAVGYSYDLDGNLTGLSYPGGLQVTRTYDHARRLTSVTDWLQNMTSFDYDADGNLTRETYPNTTTAALTYNAADELTQIVDSRAGSPFWTFGYGRDANAQLTSANDPLESLQHTYGYDVLNRLTSDAQSGGITSWGYDKADELTSITDPTSGTSTLSYDVAHELTGLSTVLNGTTTKNLTLTYNANGDRTAQSDSVSGSSVTYSYNQEGQLKGYTAGGTSAAYTYNGDGLRMSKTVGGTPYQEVWDLAEELPLMLSDGMNSYVTGPNGLPVEQISSTSVVYLYQDQLGSTRGVLDASGNIAGTYTYGPLGDVRSHTGSMTTPFQYAGQYTDSESGLQYLRARYYDPATAQFLTVDPLAYETGQPYGYAGESPLNAADPTGLFCLSPSCIASGAGDAGGAILGGIESGGRAGLIWGLKTTGDWIGRTHDDLVSGDPWRIIRAVVDVYVTVGLPLAGAGLGAKALWLGLRSVEEAGTLCIEDVLRDPLLLKGRSPGEVERDLGEVPGWRVEGLGRGSHKGQGWVLRQYTEKNNPTGRMIRWHPGGGQHGPNPYWRVTSGEGGISPVVPAGLDDR